MQINKKFITKIKSKNKHNNYLVEKLYKDNYSYFYKISFSILKNKIDTEDAVAESFIRIYKYIDKISKMECPQIVAYCVNIVKSTSFDIIRKKNRIVFLEFSENVVDDEKFSEGVDVILEKMITNQDLYTILDILSKIERDILELRAVDGLPLNEVSKQIGISYEATKKRYQRLIKKLKEFEKVGLCDD